MRGENITVEFHFGEENFEFLIKKIIYRNLNDISIANHKKADNDKYLLQKPLQLK